MNKRSHKIIIGRAERVAFPESGIENVPAKIDTGAFRTSVWATNIHEKDGRVHFTLFAPGTEWYDGKEHSTKNFEIVNIANSFGHDEDRYSIYLKIKLGRKTVTTNVTLSDRSKKKYPVLIGRKMLRNKYLVDVSEGDPLDDDREY